MKYNKRELEDSLDYLCELHPDMVRAALKSIIQSVGLGMSMELAVITTATAFKYELEKK